MYRHPVSQMLRCLLVFHVIKNFSGSSLLICYYLFTTSLLISIVAACIARITSSILSYVKAGHSCMKTFVLRLTSRLSVLQSFAENTMNELLGWYGYDKVELRDSDNLDIGETPQHISVLKGMDSNTQYTVHLFCLAGPTVNILNCFISSMRSRVA